MEIKCRLEERTSKKSGKTYKCIVIPFSDTYEKVVFLEDVEVELLNLIYKKGN